MLDDVLRPGREVRDPVVLERYLRQVYGSGHLCSAPTLTLSYSRSLMSLCPTHIKTLRPKPQSPQPLNPKLLNPKSLPLKLLNPKSLNPKPLNP